MRLASSIGAAELGPKAAAFVAQIDGRLVAVVNTAARRDPAVRDQAARALLAAGFTAAQVLDALSPQ